MVVNSHAVKVDQFSPVPHPHGVASSEQSIRTCRLLDQNRSKSDCRSALHENCSTPRYCVCTCEMYWRRTTVYRLPPYRVLLTALRLCFARDVTQLGTTTVYILFWHRKPVYNTVLRQEILKMKAR